MQVSVEIGTRKEFRLKQALLIYEDQIAKRERFVSMHDVIPAGDNTAPRLGPGHLLSLEFLKQLSLGLSGPGRAAILPGNVLACSPELLVWWTRPRLHRMFFCDGAEDRRELNGCVCPHPALVWTVSRGALYLRALAQPTRPCASTPIMVAPYWNTEAGRGSVCQGDMKRPRKTDVSTMLEWEEGFFNSRFTHPSGLGKLTTHRGGFIGLWREMAGSKNFPERYLIPARQTLERFVQQLE
jgi:PRTRC genetic system protein B